MKRYICPVRRDTCSCGRKRPGDPLAGGHAAALVVIALLFALGGISSLLITHPVLGIALIAGIILVVLLGSVIKPGKKR